MDNKKIEILDEYFKSDSREKIKELYLSAEEIFDLVNKGILIENIMKPQYSSVGTTRNVLYGKWFTVGIKHIFNYYETSFDAICITDFHFVIVEKKGRTKNWTPLFNVNIIPLEKIKSIKLTERTTYGTGYSYEVKKDPGKGALMGAAIAGTTGALMGAAINSGTKTVWIPSGMMYYEDINVEFENGIFYTWEDREGSLKSSHGTPYGIDYKNENIDFLIKRAKENLSDIEKRDIVSKSISKKGCYVATCVYGSYNCPKVWVLRRFRDYYLDNNILGRLFIKIYYAISPSIIKVFGKSKIFKKINEKILDYFVEILKLKGYQDTEYRDKY